MLKIKLYLNVFRLWPHAIVLLFSGRRNLIFQDIEKWSEAYGLSGGLWFKFFYLMTFFPEYRSVFYYRLGWISVLLKPICAPQTALYITTQNIGKGLFIQHGFATIISAASMGENCWVNQQVTIGYSNATDCPVIGNDVKIHAGAKVIGKVTIGNRAVIGANATVVKDVPDDAVVVGNPAYIVKLKGKKVHIILGSGNTL